MSKKRSKYVVPPGQPTKADVMEYARTKGIDAEKAGDQWEIWDAQSWCDGNGTPILNWKGKLLTYAKAPFGVFGGRTTEERPDFAKARNLAAKEMERLRREDEQKRGA